MKPVNDDEWMTVEELKKSQERAHTVEEEFERCQGFNTRGEAFFINNDVTKAEGCFRQAEEVLDNIEDEVSSLDIPDLTDTECQVRARIVLGLAQCAARKVPRFVWREVDCASGQERDSGTRRELPDVEDLFEEVLECCEDSLEYHAGEDEKERERLYALKASAWLGRTKVRDRIFEFECCSPWGHFSDYFEDGVERKWPDAEYGTLIEFLRPLAARSPETFEPILLDALTALARWKRINCRITNNIEIYGAGEFDPDDCSKKAEEAFEILSKVLFARRRLAERNPASHLAGLLETIDEIITTLTYDGYGFMKFKEEFRASQFQTLEAECRSLVPIARKLAGKKSMRYSVVSKRAENLLAEIGQLLYN